MSTIASTLYNESSISLDSHLFNIMVGTEAVVTLFGVTSSMQVDPNDPGKLALTGTFTLYRVFIQKAETAAEYNSCSGVIIKPATPSITLEEPVLVCCDPVTLSGCRNHAVIDVPGLYRFRASADLQADLGHFTMTYDTYPANHQSSDLSIFKNCCSCGGS